MYIRCQHIIFKVPSKCLWGGQWSHFWCWDTDFPDVLKCLMLKCVIMRTSLYWLNYAIQHKMPQRQTDCTKISLRESFVVYHEMFCHERKCSAVWRSSLWQLCVTNVFAMSIHMLCPWVNLLLPWTFFFWTVSDLWHVTCATIRCFNALSL